MDLKEKRARVDAVVAKLGLVRCANTIIGGGVAFGGHGRQRISGGERKRTSIGIEILLNPNALMLGQDRACTGCKSLPMLQRSNLKSPAQQLQVMQTVF